MQSKFVLITGSTGGLGSIITKRFWKEGYSLLLVSRNLSRLKILKDSLVKKKGQECIVKTCDLSDENEVIDFIDETNRNAMHIDVLINNAAIHGPIGVSSVDSVLDWRAAMQINLFSPALLCSAFAKKMMVRNSGVIINLSGGGATAPRPYFSCYATSKAGLVRFTETLSEEIKSSGVRVNSVAPGAMKTQLLNEILEKGEDHCSKKEYLDAKNIFEKNENNLDNIADLFIFLASDISKGITGKLISAQWDNWKEWPDHIDDLNSSDLYTIRRISGNDRNTNWGDK
tara:strand:+ start:1125 stop:1982 length:858 start_codon:yes stop_codon:yes gene_type:complete